MRVIADLHIHSKYSRAVSQSMEPATVASWAAKKGIDILGTGDFTHPEWLRELREKLEEREGGLFVLKKQFAENKKLRHTRFILQSEISCIYSKNNKTRRIHLIILVPDFKTVEKINAVLGWSSNLSSDGRPIIGMDAKELTRIILDANPHSIIIPAHIWTPWFSLYGSMSGFDSMEECFEELTGNIMAIETGLSSDPEMNWRMSELDSKAIISNSDAHSPSKLGREANIFEIEKKSLSYQAIFDILKNKDKREFISTIEFYPEEGKYHFDGHRKCKVSLSPQESKKLGYICPVCNSPLTIGVLNRVQVLSDKKESDKKDRIPYKSLVPLSEIIADVYGMGEKSKKVEEMYENLVTEYSEFDLLMDVSQKELENITEKEIAQGIIKAREGEVTRIPGYDGVFGIISVTGKIKKKTSKSIKKETSGQQIGLF